MRLTIIYQILFFLLLTTDISTQPSITVDKIWQDFKYTAERVPGFNFMNDGRHFTKLESNAITKYDLLSGNKVDDILDGKTLENQSDFGGRIGSYSFSSDEKYIVITSESEPIYRRSSKAYFHIYDRVTQKLKSVFPNDKISYATISPNGKHVAYVWKNDIYCLNLDNNVTTVVTDDGENNSIINGSADWVYEEEFSFAKAFFWSPDSKKIAYQRFDESEVPEFTLTNYRDELYPEYVTFKYPKVGEANAVVSVHIYDMEKDETLNLKLDTSEEFYVPRIKWTLDPNNLFIYKMNRHQNELQVISANTENGELATVFTEKNKYYIDITDDLTFLPNGHEFIWSSEKSGYNHLYLYDLNGSEKRPLTTGNYDVTNFYGYSQNDNSLYFQSAEKNALERQVYKVNLKSGDKEIVTPYSGTNSAQFSSTFDYYVNTQSQMNVPSSYIVYDNKNKVVRELEKNEKLINIQVEEKVQPVEFITFSTSEGVDLNGWLIKPTDFNSDKKYPVFMYLYGGPGSQQVTDSWHGQNYWWFQMLAQQGYVVACFDNRGTGGRGEEFKKMTYLQLGHYETIDQIEAAKYLGNLPYTDESRIGIFGWSYGGYMSSLCLLKGNDVFKAAIAVAPVTNWKWYDSIYTERYMRTEEENPDGYAHNAPVNFADRLKGNYLLIHGMGDDNVHFQNSAEMANALIKANKQFDTYYYPNKNHGISGGNTRLHLYNKMTNFLQEKL